MIRPRNTQTDIAGGTFAKAFDLGRFRDTSVVIDDFVGVTDRADFFKLTLARRAAGIISLTGLQANADVEIYNQQRRRTGILNNLGTRREFSSGNTPAGVYYLKVIPRGAGNTTYRLTVLTVTP